MRVSLTRDESFVSHHKLTKLYGQFLQAIDTPVALSVALQLKYGHYDDVVKRRVDPRNYADWHSYRLDAQAVSGLRKAAFLPTTINRREAALVKFRESEEVCRATNERFAPLADGHGLKVWEFRNNNPVMWRTLERARHQVARILGDPPTDLDYRFGPGVTSLVKRGVTLPKKYSRTVHVTPELYCYWRDICGPRWASRVTNVIIVAGSEISFVPKDGTTDRTIAIEPHINIYAQLGLGAALRGRFRKWVDLDTGQEFNRFLASKAQEWRLATTDLSSASDTIARALVRYLVPHSWWVLLETVRSHRYTLDGVESEFEKFSSMGNGFTFELESIIFYAIARACGSHRALTTTYGDDIITESRVVEHLHEVLEFCGFKVNRDKSFSAGSFFESCGEDFFDGRPVRPFFLKRNGPQTVFQFANAIRRWSGTATAHWRFSDARYRRVWMNILLSCPDEVRRCLVPQELGDVGFWVEWDEASPSLRIPRERGQRTWEKWSTMALHYAAVKTPETGWGGYLASLDHLSETSSAPVRGRGVYTVRPTLCSKQWSGPGPWI